MTVFSKKNWKRVTNMTPMPLDCISGPLYWTYFLCFFVCTLSRLLTFVCDWCFGDVIRSYSLAKWYVSVIILMQMPLFQWNYKKFEQEFRGWVLVFMLYLTSFLMSLWSNVGTVKFFHPFPGYMAFSISCGLWWHRLYGLREPRNRILQIVICFVLALLIYSILYVVNGYDHLYLMWTLILFVTAFVDLQIKIPLVSPPYDIYEGDGSPMWYVFYTSCLSLLTTTVIFSWITTTYYEFVNYNYPN